MRKTLALALFGIGTAIAASAVGIPSPEVDPASAGSALALLAGTIVLIRGRRRK